MSSLIAALIALAHLACVVCFYGPDNMAVDRAGHIFLADTDGGRHARLVELRADGTFARSWSIFGYAPGAQNGPEGVALTAKGTLLVTDGGTSRVLEIDPRTGAVTRFAARVAFSHLGHIAVAPDGTIYVAEGVPRTIFVFNANGTLRARWTRPHGSGIDDWNLPETIATQPNGQLVVEDWGNQRIELLSPRGTTVAVFGRRGTADADFGETAGLGVDRMGNIYVADVGRHRLAVFDARGRFMRTIARDGGTPIFRTGPSAVAFDRDGHLLVADGVSIVRLTSSGRVLARLR